jgi:soluble lytic murein transglycosylase-like protein
MTAKSAPQLLELRQSRRATLHPRTLLLLVLAIVMSSAAWLLDQQDAQVAVTAPSPQVSNEDPRTIQAAAPTPAEAAKPSENGRFRALSEFLAKRYKVSQAITFDLVTIAHAAGQQIGLDPLLIIAVIAVESRFNPIAESVQGAKGLMQVIPKYHVDKFREYGGEKYAVFDPETNILVGTQILKDYLAQTGSLNSALQLYVGASSEEDDPYIGKVMTEKQRLQQVLRKSPSRVPDIEASIAGERLASVSTRP